MIDLKPIPEFPGYFCDRDGNVYSNKSGSILKMKPKLCKSGYLNISLNRKYPMVHRLILQAWVGPSNGLHCNHKNGFKADNRLENLEWVTPLENERHSRKILGKKNHGEFHALSKITSSDVYEIKYLKALGWTYKKLTQKFGIQRSQLARIVKGLKWRHLE